MPQHGRGVTVVVRYVDIAAVGLTLPLLRFLSVFFSSAPLIQAEH